MGKPAKKIIIAVAAIGLLIVMGGVGYYATQIYDVYRMIEDMEANGYTFEQPPPALDPVAESGGTDVDWGWARTTLPTTSKIKMENPAAAVILIENNEIDFAALHISECDSTLLKKYFGESVFSPDYDPSLHTDEWLRFLGASGSHAAMLIPCSYSWWLYGQSLERYDYWDLFLGSSEVATLFILKASLLANTYERISTFETKQFFSSIQLTGNDSANCAIWQKHGTQYAEFTIQVKDNRDVTPVAQQIIAGFQFPLKKIPDENGLKQLVQDKIRQNTTECPDCKEILTLTTKQNKIAVYSSKTEKRYTVMDENGEILKQLLSEAALKSTYPEVHSKIINAMDNMVTATAGDL